MKNKFINYTRYQKRRFLRVTSNLSGSIFAFKLKYKLKRSTKTRIFLMGSPLHGNLGDQAIAFAEKELIEGNLEKYEFIDIQFNAVNQSIKVIKKLMNKDDVFILHGGGNFGIEYFEEEELRRQVIVGFKMQKVILFPQTIYFGDSDKGKEEFKKSKLIYNSHSNLTLIAREKKSYEIMKIEFANNKVLLTPDIVLYLNQSNPVVKRKGILLCFRKDVESILNPEFKEELIKNISLKNKVLITDTVVDHTIKKSKREKELLDIWASFKGSELVITDRLHGMVFAAITSTPCIVISNYNHKVKGTYEWIKHLSYIKFIENPNNVLEHVDKLLNLDPCELHYDNRFAMDYYNDIIASIKSSEVIKRDTLKEKLV
ncbi:MULTISPECIES: polysaccharide pyruvyl transferase family protein [Paraliobacillus]|uniref:polysaccharide pyruvyl transferase family protein n=1 Tax=Paraliobacillus TaxID=200903 RepID=UPI000E3ED7D2|nr:MULTISPECIES: polysaccharide pyruvyl transferase family protein [Paraliobacillus]